MQQPLREPFGIGKYLEMLRTDQPRTIRMNLNGVSGKGSKHDGRGNLVIIVLSTGALNPIGLQRGGNAVNHIGAYLKARPEGHRLKHYSCTLRTLENSTAAVTTIKLHELVSPHGHERS